MSKISAADERLIQLLLERELITEAQEPRLRSALERGMSFVEAVHKTPLVDPVRLSSLQAIATRQSQSGEIPKQKPKGEKKKDKKEEEKGPPPFEPIGARDEDADMILGDDEGSSVELDGESFELKNLGPVGSTKEEDEEEDETPVALDLDAEETPEGGFAVLGGEDEDTDFTLPEGAAEPTHSSTEVKVADQDIDLDLDEDFEMPADLDDDFDDLDLDFDHGDQPETPSGSFKKPGMASGDDNFRPSDALSALGEALGEGDDDVESRRPNSTDTVDRDLSDVFERAFSGDEEEDEDGPETQTGVPLEQLRQDPNVLRPMAPISEYEREGLQAQTFDLSKDEGIELIKQVNTMLIDALDTESTGLAIDSRKKEDNIMMYDENRQLAETSTIKGDPAQVVNRLKAMAKIEPWRGNEATKGNCNIVLDGLPRKAYVEVDTLADGEICIVHFW